MKEMLQSYSKPVLHPDQGYSRLIEEVAYLEARLIAISRNGDCACEKSLARGYSELLRARRRRLATL